MELDHYTTIICAWTALTEAVAANDQVDLTALNELIKDIVVVERTAETRFRTRATNAQKLEIYEELQKIAALPEPSANIQTRPEAWLAAESAAEAALLDAVSDLERFESLKKAINIVYYLSRVDYI